jgi:UDPglucose--hexose-1-phosphate uridylyltransferase
MQELRFNPLVGEWVIVSSATNERPTQPVDNCPVCPNSLEFHSGYDLATFDNRFPALSPLIEDVFQPDSGLLRNGIAAGKCEVIMYTSSHGLSVPNMDLAQLEKLVEMWCERYLEISSFRHIKSIFIFENRGKEVGASIQHAHGQLYSFPFIPRRLELKANSFTDYHRANHSCLVCDLLKDESYSRNIIFETTGFTAIVPYFSRFPYEIHLYPKRHVASLIDLIASEKRDLAYSIRHTVRLYDSIYNQEFPYMMTLYNPPVNTGRIYDDSYHFHIEFYPPKRAKDKLKWMASVETGTWAFVNPAEPEEIADFLRKVEVKI